MPIRSFLLAILAFACMSAPDVRAQLRFSPDSVFAQYATCSFDTSMIAWLVNDADTSIRILGVGGQKLVAADAPVGWSLSPDSTWVIPANDSVQFRLLLQSDDALGFTTYSLVASGEGATAGFKITTQRNGPVLRWSTPNLYLGQVPIGLSKSDSLWLKNIWNRDLVVSSLVIYGGDLWQVSGVELGDTIRANDSVRVKVTVTVPWRNMPATYVEIGDSCSVARLGLSVHGFIRGLEWRQRSFTATINGCPAPSEHRLVMRNTATEPMTLDSVAFTEEGWEVISSAKFRTIGPLDTFEVMIRRNVDAGAGTIVLYAGTGINDTIGVSVFHRTPNPAFSFGNDSMVFDIAIGETLEGVANDVRNNGYGEFKIQSVTIEGDPRWTIEYPDTSISYGIGRRATIKASFSGSDVAGEFPMTFTVNTTPCGQSLQRTIVARVGMLDVSSTQTLDARVYSAIDNGSLTIDAPAPYTVEVLDLLGRSALSAASTESRLTIPSPGLAPGLYIVMLRSGRAAIARPLKILQQ